MSGITTKAERAKKRERAWDRESGKKRRTEIDKSGIVKAKGRKRPRETETRTETKTEREGKKETSAVIQPHGAGKHRTTGWACDLPA